MFYQKSKYMYGTIHLSRVSDPQNFNAGPDLAFHINADPDPALIKVMRICVHWPTGLPGLYFDPPRLHFERLRPSIAPF